MAHELHGRLGDRLNVFLLQDLRVDLRHQDVHRFVEQAMVAELSLDQRARRLPGPEAGDSHLWRKLLVGGFHRLAMALFIDLDLKLHLSLRKRLGRYLDCHSFSRRRDIFEG